MRCTACSRVIVHERVHDELLHAVATRANKLALGDGLDPSTDVGPVINRAQLERIASYVKIGTVVPLIDVPVSRRRAVSTTRTWPPDVTYPRAVRSTRLPSTVQLLRRQLDDVACPGRSRQMPASKAARAGPMSRRGRAPHRRPGT